MHEILHLIIEGINEEDIKYIIKNANSKKEYRIYDSIISLDKNDIFGKDCSLNAYILDVHEETNLRNKNIYYLQKMDGFKAMYPLQNQLVKIDNKYDCYDCNDNFLCNIKKDFILKDFHYENKKIGLNGSCYKCLNPFCDHTKKGNLFENMLCETMCEKNTKLLNDISKEIKEVNKEQYVYLLELITELLKNSDISTAKILEIGDLIVNTKNGL
ncbi:hypothetical protein [Cetobacterium sp.]|uniref:hypothetical protein n=1 Tax=Cetobacterium sp. TaxID=2071632 RepID=UPI003F3D5072